MNRHGLLVLPLISSLAACDVEQPEVLDGGDAGSLKVAALIENRESGSCDVSFAFTYPSDMARQTQLYRITPVANELLAASGEIMLPMPVSRPDVVQNDDGTTTWTGVRTTFGRCDTPVYEVAFGKCLSGQCVPVIVAPAPSGMVLERVDY